MMKNVKKVVWIVFILVFLTEFAVGYYMAHVKGIILGDAISRVANAFYVLYIEPPHLAAIGSVWNPLPSLLALPFMLLWPVYPPIASSGLAGVIVTSLFAAGSAGLILKNCKEHALSLKMGLLLVLLYTFNPMIFIYGFNGMSEVPFCFSLLWLVMEMAQWMENEKPKHLFRMSLALMVAFLIRYEAIVISAFTFLAVIMTVFTSHRSRLGGDPRSGFQYTFHRAESIAVLLISPIFYAFIMWLLYNYIIMGDALYFMYSSYSNTAQSRELLNNAEIAGLMGNYASVLQYVLVRVSPFMVPLVAVIGCRIAKRKIFSWDMLAIIIIVLSTFVLQFVMLLQGTSFGWLRFFMYPLPVLLAWLPYEIHKMKSKWVEFTLILSLITSIMLTAACLRDPVVAKEEYNVVTLNGNEELDVQKTVAEYINNNLSDKTVLMDAFKTYYTIVNTMHPEKLVVTSSYNFTEALKNPKDYGIDYILVPSTRGGKETILDAVNIYYPELYESGADWCTLHKQFGDRYRLYKIEK